jgi:hypothetical protein
MQFVVIDEQRKAVDGGPAPYLDLRSLNDKKRQGAGFARRQHRGPLGSAR